MEISQRWFSVLGPIVQMQESGSNPDDIGYMSFPITVDGKQYATAGPDYTFGINVNSSIDEQIAAMVFVKWFTEQSGYAYTYIYLNL